MQMAQMEKECCVVDKRQIGRISHSVVGLVILPSGQQMCCTIVDVSIKGIGFLVFRTHPYITVGAEILMEYNGPIFGERIEQKYRVVSINCKRIGAEIVK
jgi:hypothetical protein